MSIALNLLLLTDGESYLQTLLDVLSDKPHSGLTIHVVWAQWLLIGVCGAVGFFALTLLSVCIFFDARNRD